MNKKNIFIATVFLVFFAVGAIFADGRQLADSASNMANWSGSMKRQALGMNRKEDAPRVLETGQRVLEEFQKLNQRFQHFNSDGKTMTQQELDRFKSGMRTMQFNHNDILNHHGRLLRMQ